MLDCGNILQDSHAYEINNNIINVIMKNQIGDVIDNASKGFKTSMSLWMFHDILGTKFAVSPRLALRKLETSCAS